MAKLELIPDPLRSRIAKLSCPTFDTQPWTQLESLKDARVALVSTAGIHNRDDRAFSPSAGDYRVIKSDSIASDIVMTHVSKNFDRTGFQLDWNVVFPLDRLRELAEQEYIGSVADYHYSFMGATDPAKIQPYAEKLAGHLTNDKVDAILLVPV